MTTRSRLATVLLGLSVAAGCGSDGAADTTTVAPATTAAIATTATTAAAPDVSAARTPPPDLEDDPAKDNRPPRPDEIDTSTGFPRVCLMLSLDVVSSATGASAVSSHEGASGGTTTCFVEDDAGENILAMGASPSARFTEAAAAADARPVDGLGDGAVWSDGRLHVAIGDEALSFRLYPAAGVDDASAEAVVEQIAADTLPRYQPPPDD
jgi:hypothetical protein